MTLHAQLADQLQALDANLDNYATQFIDLLLARAREAGASDLHLHPVVDQLQIRWRIDGVLSPVGTFALGTRTDPIARLKVLAGLLTYKQDVPQEGRLRIEDALVEMRVSTFPSLYGERAVVRIVSDTVEPWRVVDLGLPAAQTELLRDLLKSTSGGIIVTGPTGAGKTTTVYACLREIVAESGAQRSISTLEDPIESAIEGAAQSQVNAAAGFTMPLGLRSLLRQDPEVILVGEIRDRETASVALQAALTGQLMLSTFHATSACGALSRLANMGIEDYVLRTGVTAVLNQRLFRKLCSCRRVSTDERDRLGFASAEVSVAGGCEQCHATGYRGRLLVAELLQPSEMLVGDAWHTMEAAPLEQAATAAGMIPLWEQAEESVARGETSPSEVCRVLGIRRR